MQAPIQVDLPHKLGKAEARARIADNIHKLKDHIPGGTAQVQSAWTGDRLDLDIQAMAQTVAAAIEVEDTLVRVRLTLPGLLGMFAGPIQAALRKKGAGILLEDHRKD